MHNYKTPSGKSLEKYIPDPFTRLENGTCLHDRPEKDVFKLLIDALRMREQDLYKLGGEIAPRSLYSGESSSIASFREFLTGVEKKKGYMPLWWNADKRKECEEFGEKGGDWSNLRKKVVKDEMIKHYGNERVSLVFRGNGK
jgi:splicing suppressor protein 51